MNFNIFLLSITLIGVCHGMPYYPENVPKGMHWIPTLDRGYKLISDAEIRNFIDPEPFKYNPYTDMEFRLFTRNNPVEAQLVNINDRDSLSTSFFNPELPTRMMIHGWGGNGINDGAVIYPMRAYLEKGEYNYFAVDWSKGSSTPNYLAARNRSNATAIVMGQFIEFLIREGNAKLKDFRIGGFSLGGQVVGFVGKYLKGELPVIYGLDPAGVLFNGSPEDDRLHSSDAKYVEVIHTSGLKLGYDKPLGHADFFANGGRAQPGCILDVTGSCAHGRALMYFAESINSNEGFWGEKCESRDDITAEGCLNSLGTFRKMGDEPVNPSDDGSVYYFKTNKKEPFALGKGDHLIIEN